MADTIEKLKTQALAGLQEAKTLKELDDAYKHYVGKKGELTQILRSLALLPATEKERLGKAANDLKTALQSQFEQRKQEIQQKEISEGELQEVFDVTAPGVKLERGHLNPLTLVQRRATEIFRDMGFGVAEGPEIETEWYNFDALNIPASHPARDMWDTFWLKPQNKQKLRLLLRTHTSPVQIRYMEQHNPPLRIIAPGRVFRYEATDARHGFQLYQLEGLLIGKTVSVAHFRAILQEFYKRFFGKPVTIRLRPSYFPFVEPGFEADMSCIFCNGTGTISKEKKCSSCGGAGWIEMLGAGMVHPNVFKAAGYIPNTWQGFAFGMGIDRLAMMKYNVPDIRLFYGADLHFLQQF